MKVNNTEFILLTLMELDHRPGVVFQNELQIKQSRKAVNARCVIGIGFPRSVLGSLHARELDANGIFIRKSLFCNLLLLESLNLLS